MEAWEQLREKIISIEIALLMDVEDCLAIGLRGMPKEHFELFSDRVKRLKITNIRALQHMGRVYNALAAEKILDDSHWPQLIPSIALYVALHLGVIGNVPAIEQALNEHGFFGYDIKELSDDEIKALSEKALSDDEIKAKEFLADYNLGMPDDFEAKILVPYLRTGYLDTKSLAAYVAEIGLRRRRRDAETALEDLITRRYWDATISTGELLALVEQNRAHLDVLNAGHATRLANLASQLERPSLSDAIVGEWLEFHKSRLSTEQIGEHFLDFPDEIEGLHPVIQDAYRARYHQLYPPFSLRESVEYLSMNSSWGSRQSIPVENATQEEFENLIRTADPRLLARVLRFFSKHVGRPGIFQVPAAHFAEACRDILKKEPDSRLANIIKRAFLVISLS